MYLLNNSKHICIKLAWLYLMTYGCMCWTIQKCICAIIAWMFLLVNWTCICAIAAWLYLLDYWKCICAKGLGRGLPLPRCELLRLCSSASAAGLASRAGVRCKYAKNHSQIRSTFDAKTCNCFHKYTKLLMQIRWKAL